MKKNDIAKAWRSQDAFLALSSEERNEMPANPAGAFGVFDAELGGVFADRGTHYSFCDPTASWCDDCSPQLPQDIELG